MLSVLHRNQTERFRQSDFLQKEVNMSQPASQATIALLFAVGDRLFECRLAQSDALPQVGDEVELNERDLHTRSHEHCTRPCCAQERTAKFTVQRQAKRAPAGTGSTPPSKTANGRKAAALATSGAACSTPIASQAISARSLELGSHARARHSHRGRNDFGAGSLEHRFEKQRGAQSLPLLAVRKLSG